MLTVHSNIIDFCGCVLSLISSLCLLHCGRLLGIYEQNILVGDKIALYASPACARPNILLVSFHIQTIPGSLVNNPLVSMHKIR